MPFPETLWALMVTGSQVKIVGAARVTRKPIIVFDKEMFRDSPPPLAATGAVDQLTTGSGIRAAMEISGGVEVVLAADPAGTDWTGIGTMLSKSSILQDDSYTHVPKRYVPKLDTLVQFWDDADAPGIAMGMDVTVSNGSAIITVPDASLLTPGQSISDGGTLIPEGTIILSIFTQANGVIDATKAVMSKKALNDGVAEAVLTGSNLVGEFMQSEFIDWGSENGTPT